MLLVIPSIEIAHGACVRTMRRADDGFSTDDPIEMAVLWRKENAKTLHIIDRDGTKDGRIINTEAIKKLTAAVDIPMELGCTLRIVNEVQRAFDCGIYRVIVDPVLLENPGEAEHLLRLHGSSRVAVGIGPMYTPAASISVAESAKKIGFTRIMYGDIMLENPASHSYTFDALKSFTSRASMRVTACGGVSTLDELLKLQEIEPIGVDSVVIGDALYENKFACQGLWRMCESGEFPFTAKI